MPSYHTLGQIPRKRHTQFRRPDSGLDAEEVFGTEGFSGRESILYHTYPPTRVARIESRPNVVLEPWDPGCHRHHHFVTSQLGAEGDPITSRRVLMANDDVAIGIARPVEPMTYYYRNARADEVLFVHEGRGRVRSTLGNLEYRPGDFVIIPRGVTYTIDLAQPDQRWLFFESFGPVDVPRRYRNEFGQLMEHAPYCERDVRKPTELETRDERGDFEVRIKLGPKNVGYWFDFHPLSVVGWDGYLYPWALNIGDFEPITGRVHQPPPVHQTFQGRNFVICSFVPRKLDYHPEAVPVPYNHSNIDSDEVIYYVSGSFGSRRGIEIGSITLHPHGIPHGPQPGAVEASLGKESTDELAVMIDTFRPLHLTKPAAAIDDPKYPFSWLSS
ncbi:MAG TPA: homogentisate 1,2-dioxygenase [Chloroflexota bacterium]|nr:homogentisate 1,2-dioxygenase [Chloroflexota bacterium]